MTNLRKILASLLIVGAVAAIAGVGSYSAFTATTASSGNQISSGTVALSDDDSGQALYNISNATPGDSADACTKVTYSGSMDADVRLYTTNAAGPLDQYLLMVIYAGTGSDVFPGCDNFSADGSAIFVGTVKQFADTHNSWANGLQDYPGTSATKWSANDSVVYRIQIQLNDNNSAQGLSSGVGSFTWEARNQ